MEYELDLDDNQSEVIKEPKTKTKKVIESKDREVKNEDDLINCLVNKRVVIRYIIKPNAMITNPKHVLYGGLGETAVRFFTVPVLRDSGALVNVLTNQEKDYLEHIMGLEKNALSVYQKVNNYWHNFQVKLTKQDNYLDLSNPEQYIKYKVLLANKDFICPSMKDYEERHKATYQFVIVDEEFENKKASLNITNNMEAYLEFGKITDNANILRTIIEIAEGKSISDRTKLNELQIKVNNLIQANTKMFLSIVKDPLLETKALIKEAVDKKVISIKDGSYYFKKTNSPLCNDGEFATLVNAAKFLTSPKNQELLFTIQALIKQ